MAGFFEEYAKYSTPPMYDLSEMTPEEGKGMMRTMLDSATIVGLGGEIEAGIRAPFSDKNFQEIDSQINKEQAAYKEKYPNEYTAFSGLGMGSTIMASAPAAVTRVVGTGLAKNVGASTVLGGLGGFLAVLEKVKRQKNVYNQAKKRLHQWQLALALLQHLFWAR